MNWQEHNPPHFHVEYNGYQASISIINSEVISGYLPNRQLKLALAWCEIHRDELMQNWELARDNQALNRIEPLK